MRELADEGKLRDLDFQALRGAAESLGRHPNLLFEESGEMVLAVESKLEGNLFDGFGAPVQEGPGLLQLSVDEILIRRQPPIALEDSNRLRWGTSHDPGHLGQARRVRDASVKVVAKLLALPES